MTSKFSLWALLLTATLAFTSSCEKDNDAPEQLRINANCLVVNQGNFSQSNGSISLYNSQTDSVSNGIFSKASGRDFAAILIDAAIANNYIVITCNLTDKVEILDRTTFIASEPITNVINPRMIAAKDNKAYVSCWGKGTEVAPYFYQYFNSYIAVIDLVSKRLTDSIPCGNEAEGVYIKDNNLYVAVADGVEIYTLPNVTFSKKITTSFGTTARRIDEDKNGKLWVSFNGYSGGTAGFAAINTNTQSVEKEVVLDKFDSDGKFALTKDKSQVLYAAPVIENWVTTSSDIYTISADTHTVSTTPIISGTALSTICVNSYNGDIYTANTDYSANNNMLIYNESGTQKSTVMVGVALQKILFY